MTFSKTPRVALSVDVIERDQDQFHITGEKYIYAVAEASGCMPLILPSLTVSQRNQGVDEIISIDLLNEVLDDFDGLVLTGSDSNIQPSMYGHTVKQQKQYFDPQRDSSSVKLIDIAIKKQIPTLGICRGLQEINIALGGTLHQAVQEVPEHLDHRYKKEEPEEVQYGPRHSVTLSSGGILSEISQQDVIKVNSLHSQGIDELAELLRVEAVAEDGLVEAVSIEAHPFFLAVQWHPEWHFWENPFSEALLDRFGQACRERLQTKQN